MTNRTQMLPVCISQQATSSLIRPHWTRGGRNPYTYLLEIITVSGDVVGTLETHLVVVSLAEQNLGTGI